MDLWLPICCMILYTVSKWSVYGFLEVELAGLKQMVGQDETLFTIHTRITKNRVNASFAFLVDIDESFEVRTDFYVTTKPCYFFTSTFTKYFTAILEFIVPPVDDLCPFRKGEHYFENAKSYENNIPTYSMKAHSMLKLDIE